MTSSSPLTHQQIVRQALRRSGGISKWARHFGIGRSSVYDWIANGAVPPDRAVVIERESHRLALRQELRPRDYWQYWPDLPKPGSGETPDK